MKQIARFLVLTLILQSLVFGQTTVTTQAPAENPNSIDGQFSNPTNLTDAQMTEAKDFVHQGQKDRVIKEKCAAVNDCKEGDEGFPIEMLIGKAYAMVGMIGGFDLATKGAGKPAATTEAKPHVETGESVSGPGNPVDTKPGADSAKDDKKTDYCIMVAMGMEAVSTIMQTQGQKPTTTTTPGDEQLQALVHLQETHKTRAKTAKFQGTIYGGVTGCYVYMAATGAAMDGKFMLKMGGAAALTMLYLKKANKHKKAADAVGEVIASLEWAGKNCNPYTKSACFCSEPTSKELYPSQYEEVCVLNKGNFETPKIALGCTAMADGKLSYDKECKCKVNNTCMKSNIRPFNPSLNLSNNLMGDPNKTFELLGKGEYDQGLLDKASLTNAALANKIGAKANNKVKTPALTPEQKKIAKELEKVMPSSAAAVAASLPPSNKNGILNSGVGSSAISKLSPAMQAKLADAIDGNYKTGGGDTSFSKDDDQFVMPQMPGQETAAKEGTEVMDFAEKAISKADVSNAPSTPIFDIISNRYRRSGWAKLDTEGK